MRSALFWDVMRCIMAIPYWHFRTTYRCPMFKIQEFQEENFSVDLLTLKMGPISCSETSIRIYHYMCVIFQKTAGFKTLVFRELLEKKCILWKCNMNRTLLWSDAIFRNQEFAQTTVHRIWLLSHDFEF